MSTQHDSWGASSGLPLDGATVAVTNAQFSLDASIAEGAVFMVLEFTDEATGETKEQSYSCGQGWEIRDKGARVQHTNTNAMFYKSTNYAIWYTAALKCAGAEQVLRSRGTTTDAAVWLGTRWVLGTVTTKVVNPKTGVEKEASKIIPVQFLGVSDGTNIAAAGAVTRGASSNGDTLDPGVAAALAELAAALKADGRTFDDFMAEGLDVPGVRGVKVAQRAVTDRRVIWDAVN